LKSTLENLKGDFEYNLKLVYERDNELDEKDNAINQLEHQMNYKESYIQSLEDKIKDIKCQNDHLAKDINNTSRTNDQELQLSRDQLADKKVELIKNETHFKVELDSLKRNYESKLSTYVNKIESIQKN